MLFEPPALLGGKERLAAFGIAETVSVPTTVPHLAILPFADISNTPTSGAAVRGLAEEVAGQIAKFREIVVTLPNDFTVPPAGGAADDEAASPPVPQPRYALEGSVRAEDDRLRLLARLIRRSDGTIVWADTYDETLGARDLMDVQAEIAAKVASKRAPTR